MAAAALFVITLLTVAVSLVRPWIGVMAYYVLALLFPQAIWPWAFGSWRISYIVAVAVVLAFLGHLALRSLSLSVWRSRPTITLLVLWAAIAASYYAGGYVGTMSPERAASASRLLEGYSKTFLFFMIAQPLLLTLPRVRYLALVVLGVTVYYTYWANAVYLQGDLTYFTLSRLGGPATPTGESIFGDENAFAMSFVVALPFMYFLAQQQRRALVRWALYLAIPFAWHAVFLTGSRGGLLGLVVVGLHALFRSPRKGLALVGASALVVAFVTQGGDVMKSRSGMILDYEDDPSATGRLDAWSVAGQMTLDHPVTGVGLGRFMAAWPDYAPPDTRPRVTHSSTLHLAAESGLFAAGAFLLLMLYSLADLRGIRALAATPGRAAQEREADFVLALVNAIEGALVGYFVCGLFLNLQTYDIFYVLVLLVVCLRRVVASWVDATRPAPSPALAGPARPAPALPPPAVFRGRP